MKYLPILVVLLFQFGIFGCAGAIKPVKSEYYAPEAIFSLLDSSEKKYEIKIDSQALYSMRKFRLLEDQASPEWMVIPQEESLVLSEYKANFCAASESKIALDLLGAKNYEASLQSYKRAFECDTNYVKLLTYIGNLHFIKEDYNQAIAYFKKALEKNPRDYQAHYFISNAFFKTDSLDKAVDAFIEAYLLNRKSANLNSYGRVLLEAAGLQLTERHLEFGFSIQATQNGAKINVSNPMHLPMATCLAAYEFEEKLKNDGFTESVPQKMFRNCLANQAVVAKVKHTQNISTDSIGLIWSQIMDENLLASVVVWEIGTNVSAQIPYLLPEDVIADVRRYVREYLIQKK